MLCDNDTARLPNGRHRHTCRDCGSVRETTGPRLIASCKAAASARPEGHLGETAEPGRLAISENERRRQICAACTLHVGTGCWKDFDYGCWRDRDRARENAVREAACPLGKLADDDGKPGQRLFLPEIKTIVYTADKPHCRARHAGITAMMRNFGFQNWGFYLGKAGEPYWQAIRPEFAAILRQHDPPLLFLEDDAKPRDFQPRLRIPPGTEVAYLGGGGSWPGGPLVPAARARLPEVAIYRVREIGFADIPGETEWVRVFGMFGTHAMLFLDRRVMLEMADTIDATNEPVDVAFGGNQWRWQCALRKIPLWYQADGHNDGGTFDYATPRPEESIPQRNARLRQQRRMSLAH